MLSPLIASLYHWFTSPSHRVRQRRQRVQTAAAADVLEARQLLAAAVLPRLSVRDAVISESDAATRQVEVTVTLEQPATVSIPLTLTTRSRTAIAGLDFVSRSVPLTIPAGQTSVTADFSIRDDTVDERDEVFDVVLTAGRRITIVRPVGAVTILDDDLPPALSVGDVAINEGGIASVPVTLSHPSSLPVTVTFQTLDHTASSATDFVPVSSIVTLPAGTTTLRVPVTTRADVMYEADETLVVQVSSISNATLDRSRGTVTILNNDVVPLATVTPTNFVEGHDPDSARQLQLRLNAVSGVPAVVSYSLVSRTAKAGIDYIATGGTLVIPAGHQSASIPVTLIGNHTDDPNRTFVVVTEALTDVRVATAETLITITDDDGVTLPLYSASDLKYLGAFQLPTGLVGSATFEFGGNALAWNPENGSLFIGANVQLGLHVAEIALPGTLGRSVPAAQLPTAQVLQPFADLGQFLTTDASGADTPPSLSYLDVNLGGLLVTDGGLTGAMFTGYNGVEPHESTHTHFRTSSLNLASLDASSFVGLKDIRPTGSDVVGRMLGGYMAAVPERWRQWIGSEFVTGAAGLNRIQTSSSGPALFGFDAAAPENSLHDPLVYYPFGKALQWMDPAGRRLAPAQPLFNGTTKIEGVAFVPGTRSVIFIGSNGLSQIGYGVGTEFRDRGRVYRGYHSQNGLYRYQVWAYDIDDFVAVRNGAKSPWSLKPTFVHNFDLPTPEPAYYLGGTAFDPATGRLFVSQKSAGPGFTPVIHVYQLGRN